jgi:hypothetical protein
MTRREEESDLTPAERVREVARVLAAGILRLRGRAMLDDTPQPSPSGNPPKSAQNCLEVAGKTRLSVQDG